MDNNVVASPRFKEIIAEIRDLGFVPGAKLTRPGQRPESRRKEGATSRDTSFTQAPLGLSSPPVPNDDQPRVETLRLDLIAERDRDNQSSQNDGSWH